MNIDLNPVIWNEVMNICIDIEKGQIDHIDGTAKIQETIEGYLKEATTDVAAERKYELRVNDIVIALGDTISGLIKFYNGNGIKGEAKIVDRETGITAISSV